MDPRLQPRRPAHPQPRPRPGTPPSPVGALELPSPLRRLVTAECAAEAPAAGVEAEDLQQAVWLRLLERSRSCGVTVPSTGWLRSAVRAEARRARRRARREVPLPADVIDGRHGGPESPRSAETAVLAEDHRRALSEAVAKLPGRCPALMRVLLSRQDLTYAEIARELGMSQGSLGPVRSRCLGCLRTMLKASDCGM